MVKKTKLTIKKIKKRDGRIVPFEQEKITEAIFKAARAVGGKDRKRAKFLSDKVVKILEERFNGHTIATVEQIQDIVERILMTHGHVATAKAYILYRDLHTKLRDVRSLIDSDELMGDYLNKTTWLVRENSNMAFSLQGLNNHVASAISSRYWLNKLYPKEVREAHTTGALHLHNLQLLAPYCVGWDLYDLLVKGFQGVPGKIACAPAKHLRTALGQLVNFFYTMQGESAGANAISSFDTLLAPFVVADGLSYKEVKQAMQEFLFNMNVPTRVGFQCISEDTEILTREGWKGYKEIKKGSIIKTFNVKTQKIENQRADYIFKEHYEGSMYNLKNRIQDQLISPQHRVVRKKFQTEKYVLEPIEEIVKLKSPFIIPIAGENSNKRAKISDKQIKLMAWIISEGTIERPGKHRCCYRVSIYQSKIKNKKNYEAIKSLLNHFKMKYSESETASLGSNVARLRLNAESSRVIHQWFGTRENVHFIPDILLNLNQEQSRMFLGAYLKADGSEGCKISTGDPALLDELQRLVVNCGYGFTVLVRKPTIGKKEIYVLRIIKHQETYIQKVEKVKYQGVIWSPHTKNETVIARRKGKVFITGNTPFTNITLDLKPPVTLRNEAAIVGGKPIKKQYKDFQKEMDMINKTFAEVMLEGDAQGRVFTFPIPTYNITKDFEWGNGVLAPVWEMAAKYGLPYFSNFINSDMKPEDVRSMCCRLRLSHRELKKRGGGYFGSNPLTGSIGVVTINLAQIGFLAKNEKEFFERLGRLMEIARDSLLTKRRVLERFTSQGLYPYSKFYLEVIKKRFGGYWKNHFNTIGINGMNEALLNFMKKDIGTKAGRVFALKVLNFMRKKLGEYQEEANLLFNLEATPAEGTSYRFAKIDKKLYPKIIVANEEAVQKKKAEPYYTNSTQLPVDYTDDFFEALDLQDELQTKYTGGCVEKGNKVLTDKGLLKIEDIVKNFEKLRPIKAVSYNPEKGISEWDEIVNVVTINVEKKDKIRIKGERNLDIVTSDWHPFFVLGKIRVNPLCPICRETVGNIKGFAAHLRWNPECREKYNILPKYRVGERRADKLKIGNYILQNSNNLYLKKRTELNNDLMWLIGFFIGDGCISGYIDNRGGNNLKKYKIRFNSDHNEALEKASSILSRYFHCNATVIQNDKRSKDLRELSTSKQSVLNFFFKYGFEDGKKVYDVYVPVKVKENLNEENVFSLLSGLMDSDGHISRRDGDIEYYTVSPKLADDLLEICTRSGLMISKKKKKTYRSNEVDIYRLRIPAYQATKIRDRLANIVNPSRIKEDLSNRGKRHLPVARVKEVSKVEVEDNQFYDLTTKKNHNYLAGKDSLVFIHNTVLHGFLGERLSNGEMTKRLVKKIAENYRLPYFTFTPTFSVCSSHGYIKGEKPKCPKCKRRTEVYSRVVGYLRPVGQWNPGKQAEFAERKEFIVK